MTQRAAILLLLLLCFVNLPNKKLGDPGITKFLISVTAQTFLKKTACRIYFDLFKIMRFLQSTKRLASRSLNNLDTCADKSLLLIYWSMLKSIVGLKYGI